MVSCIGFLVFFCGDEMWVLWVSFLIWGARDVGIILSMEV